MQQEVTVDFEEITFGEALDSLTEQTGLTFVAIEEDFNIEDLPYPIDVGVVTLKMQDQSLETVLSLLMRQLDETDFIVWNGVIYIAPKEVCEKKNEPYFFVYLVEQALKPKPKQPEQPPKVEPDNANVEQEEPFDFGDDFDF